MKNNGKQKKNIIFNHWYGKVVSQKKKKKKFRSYIIKVHDNKKNNEIQI